MKYLTLVVIVLLAGCAALPPPTPLATLDDRRVVEEKRLADGAARVYLFVGEGVYGTKPKQPCHFFVNNTMIGAGNYDMFVVVDLEPGRYSIHWQFTDTNTYFSSVPLDLELRANDHVYLLARTVDASVAGSQWFGLIGGLLGTKFHYVMQQIPAEGPAMMQQKQLAAFNTSLKGAVR